MLQVGASELTKAGNHKTLLKEKFGTISKS